MCTHISACVYISNSNDWRFRYDFLEFFEREDDERRPLSAPHKKNQFSRLQRPHYQRFIWH